MDENAVVENVCTQLRDMGCEIVQSLTTKQQGIDIIARDSRSGREFIVEAKGGTSSREGSPRFGRSYTSSQVFDRAAKGVFSCIHLRAKYPDRLKQHVILAVPNSQLFLTYLKPVMPQLLEAGIEVWFTPDKLIQGK